MANELATSKDITNYLKHVFDLEKMLYQQNEILEHLRDSIGSCLLYTSPSPRD